MVDEKSFVLKELSHGHAQYSSLANVQGKLSPIVNNIIHLCVITPLVRALNVESRELVHNLTCRYVVY